MAKTVNSAAVLFTEVKKENLFPTSIGLKIFLRLQLSPSGGLVIECRFSGTSVLALFFWEVTSIFYFTFNTTY